MDHIAIAPQRVWGIDAKR
ncbi:hypothetical protein [Sinomonas sp. ASV322]